MKTFLITILAITGIAGFAPESQARDHGHHHYRTYYREYPGNEATGGDSPEIHYFLGLAYLNLKDLDLASEHARRAYDLGYPLPGLRNKLAAAGRPIG